MEPKNLIPGPLENYPGASLKEDNTSKFIRNKEKFESEINVKLKAPEMRQYKPLCYRLSELQQGTFN